MKKSFLTIILFFFIASCHILTAFAGAIPPIKAESDKPELEADAAILMDATTGEILYEKNIHKKEYPASITKLMTVLLAFESDKMDETITFSHDAVFGIEPNSSHIAVDVGEKLTMEQAMYAIMLQSANEVSLGVAEQIDGSKEAFARHMTERAKQLGCTNTNFVNPNGLHSENHYTSAYDMALIAKELIKFDEFKKVMGTIRYEIPPTNTKTETRYLYGQHQMIKPPSLYCYEGCEGGKTGYTNEAMNTLVTYAKRDDTELVAVVFKCKGAGHYVDTTKLFDYGFANFKTVKVFSATDFSKTVPVTETYKKRTTEVGQITLKPLHDFYKTIAKNTSVCPISQKVICDKQYPVPIEKNAVLGSIAISEKGKLLGTVDLVAQQAFAATPLEEKQAAEKALWANRLKTGSIIGCTIIFLVILLLLLFLGIRNIRRKRRKRRRRSYYQSNRRNFH